MARGALLWLLGVPLAPAQLLQGLPERRQPGLTFRIVRGTVHEDANPARLLGLLRACRERPCDRNSNNFDEISPAHVTLRNEVKDDASFQSLSDYGGNVRFGS
jgi:hypothetical protein